MQKNCSCFWPKLFIPAFGKYKKIPLMLFILYNEGDDNSSSIRPCNISNNPDNEDRICYEETIEKFDKRERVCPCGVACKERNFQSTISSSTWPSNQVMKIFINLH